MNLIGMMLCHNEGKRYLREVIENSLKFCNSLCILLERCTDNSRNIIRELQDVYPDRIFYRKAKFSWDVEWELRNELLQFSLEYNPDYLIAIDADELFEENILEFLEAIEYSNANVIAFRFYDMWDSLEYYRFDKFYQSSLYYSDRMFKVEDVDYVWNKIHRHCGSIPINAIHGKRFHCPTRIAHMGWMKEEDRIAKCEDRRKEEESGKGRVFPKEVYDAILDKNPHLEKF